MTIPKPAKGTAVSERATRRRARARERARIRAAGRREEVAIIARVRAACVARDGYCRVAQAMGGKVSFLPHAASIGWCSGPSEWAHFGEAKRYKTRGQAPEVRHRRDGSLMLCAYHHALYDRRRPLTVGAHWLHIEALTDQGTDGRLAFRRGGVRVEEA